MSKDGFIHISCCIVVVAMLVVLIMVVGCGKVEPTSTSVPLADTLVPPVITSEPTSTPVPTSAGDGRVITFVSNRDGSSALHVMNADSGDQRRLADKRIISYDWSPDGTRIAFTSLRDERYEIYIMPVPDGLDPDSIDHWQLTSSDDDDWWPAWSPDSTQIAFTSNRDGNDEIYVIAVSDGPEADGNAPRLLTDNRGGQDVDPTWSPDGSRIAFVSDRDGNDEIYVMNADGTDQQRLTNNDVDDWWPAWSPDGTRIAFTSGRDGNDEIYVMAAPNGSEAGGSDQRRLTNTDAKNWCPAWSLDGSQIVFQSVPIGQWNWNIYVMNSDGTNQQQLTDGDAADEYPVWRP